MKVPHVIEITELIVHVAGLEVENVADMIVGDRQKEEENEAVVR
jgi:hypothetical protein